MQLLLSPLTLVSISFLTGIVLARSVPQETGFWLQGSIASLGVAILFLIVRQWRDKKGTPRFLIQLSPIHFLLPLFLFLGAAFFQYQQPDAEDPANIIWFTDSEYEIVIKGIITKWLFEASNCFNWVHRPYI